MPKLLIDCESMEMREFPKYDTDPAMDSLVSFGPDREVDIYLCSASTDAVKKFTEKYQSGLVSIRAYKQPIHVVAKKVLGEKY